MNRENEIAMFAGKKKSGLTKEQVGLTNGLKNYVWVKKFEITAHTKEEAIDQLKFDFESDSVIISGRDLPSELEYSGIEKSNDYDKKMYEFMQNEYSDNPKNMDFPKETSQERKERLQKWATELD